MLLQGLSSQFPNPIIIPKKHHSPCSSVTSMESEPAFPPPDTHRSLQRRKKKGIHEYTRHHFHGNLQCRWAWGSRLSQSTHPSSKGWIQTAPPAPSRMGRAWEGSTTGTGGVWQLWSNRDEELRMPPLTWSTCALEMLHRCCCAAPATYRRIKVLLKLS